MQIHSTAKFSGHPLGYHYNFEIDIQRDQVEPNAKGLTNLAIKGMRQKCLEVFFVDFEKMDSFEVYFYEKGKEVTIFKKAKE